MEMLKSLPSLIEQQSFYLTWQHVAILFGIIVVGYLLKKGKHAVLVAACTFLYLGVHPDPGMANDGVIQQNAIAILTGVPVLVSIGFLVLAIVVDDNP